MHGPGFRVLEEALQGYANRVPGLADSAVDPLATLIGLPPTSFSDLGAEVGLPEAFGAAVRAQVDGLAAATEALHGLGGSIGAALHGYQQQDELHASRLDRADEG